MAADHDGQPVIDHPNRDRAVCRTTRITILVLLAASAVLIAVILIGGWSVLQGMKAIAIAWILLCGVFATYVVRWNRGVLPVIAALAVILMIFAGIAIPTWVHRDAPGFAEASLSAGVLATLTVALAVVQALLAGFALQGFGQAWNVEVERRPEDGPGSMAAGA